MVKKRVIYLLIFLSIFLLLPFLSKIVSMYIDWLFFTDTGYKSVFIKILTTKITMALFFSLPFVVFAGANIFVANKGAFPQRELFSINGIVYQIRTDNIERILKIGGIIVSIFLTFFIAQWGIFKWEDFLLFKNGIDLKTYDPILGRDVGFYLFKMPFIEDIKAFISATLILSILMTGAIYLIRGGIFLSGTRFSIDRKVSTHLGILVCLFMFNMGFGFYLDAIKLLFSGYGIVFGAGYTDIEAKLLFYRILIVVAPIAGIVLLYGAIRGSLKKVLIPLGVVFILYIAGLAIYPSVLQKFKVEPNELALETPYIKNNITFTRQGYNLDKIEVRPFDVDYKLTLSDIEKNNATIKNIRLWDHKPLLKTYSQLQQIRTYYRFADVDNDRYIINNEYMQVMLSPRELSYQDLPSKTWINERLVFTHGYGLALGPVSRISKEGLPEFIIKDIPPESSSADIKITRPEIYFGELSNDYVVVNTKAQEFSYPTTEGNVYTEYEGKGGIILNSYWKRAIFSLYLRTEKMLLSSDIRSNSKILIYRNISERVKKLAPFLLFDEDPYLVIKDNGRLVWVVDAYTISKRMPYSTPIKGGINYIRNSVKTVIDAYDGTVEFFISDTADPVLNVYSNIFRGVFKPISQMPEDLKKHIRYPENLFQIQAAMYTSYHMTDPQVFYNKENLWEIPKFGESTMEPYYTIMRLPGEKKEEYILLLPYTPAKRDNLAAWFAARCDMPNYGKLIVYTFPRDRLVYGPKQIDARINQDSFISQQLTLWGQRGSQVIRGSLLVIPIESSLLYVQPLYLAAADRAGLPELRRVILAYENYVVMEENLDTGLSRLFGTKKVLSVEPTKDLKQTVFSPYDLAREALKVFEKAVKLQKEGNWAGYGDELKKLEKILREMNRK